MKNSDILTGKRIVLGVTGSIACYKAVDLSSKLTQLGALVDVILTQSAQEFVSPLTFRSLTHRSVITDLFDPESENPVEHIALAKEADAILVAPATANIIAKISHGFADETLSATILATESPILLAPAMENQMWKNTVTESNIKKLTSRGMAIVGPSNGRLASGGLGEGRLAPVEDIIENLINILSHEKDLSGKHIVVSAGGTQEPLDPVRVITNHSSGKQGYAIAQAALDRGARVTLVTAPTSLTFPSGAKIISIKTAREMLSAITDAINDKGDVLIMAAAVADWESQNTANEKIKKKVNQETMTIQLKKTPDILKSISSLPIIKIGFAAETEDLLSNARSKLKEKALDMIVANDVSSSDAGFGVNNNRVTILNKNGDTIKLPLLSKLDVAHNIIDALLKIS